MLNNLNSIGMRWLATRTTVDRGGGVLLREIIDPPSQLFTRSLNTLILVV